MSVEIEQQVIGGLLYDNAWFQAAADLIPEAFSDPFHAQVFQEVSRRLVDGDPVDASTIKFAFSNHDAIGNQSAAEYILRMQLSAPSKALFPEMVKELRSAYSRRLASDALRKALQSIDVFEPGQDAASILSDVQASLSAASSVVETKPLTTSFVQASLSAVQNAVQAKNQGGAVGVSTGSAILDRKLGALNPGNLYVLAGRPGMGKSAVAFNWAIKAAMRGEGVFFASLEMTVEQLQYRFFSQVMAERGRRVQYAKIVNGSLTDDEFEAMMHVAQEFENLPVRYSDESCKDLGRLLAAADHSARVLQSAGKPLSLIVVDYLQLIRVRGVRPDNINATVSQASGSLKALARRHNVPVIVLSQLNRQVEHRDPPIPALSDLRDSGSIEQDADAVLFAFRPEYYTIKRLEAARSSGQSIDKIADVEAELARERHRLDVIVGKQRMGAGGKARLHCEIAYNLICDPNEVPDRAEDFE